MRTAMLFGLMTISDSIAAQTGFVASKGAIGLGAAILIACVIADIFDLFIKK